MAIDALKKTYRTEGLVLAIGAGVSKGAGLPDWSELLQRIGERLGEGGREMIGTLIEHRFSFPSIAGMLRASLCDAEAFADVMRAELYEGFPFFPGGIPEGNSQALIDHIQTNPKAQTLRAVAAFCAVAVNDEQNPQRSVFARNPQVHAIVNFNIDTVLREYIGVRYPRADQEPIVRTIERASKSSNAGKINLYHVHGNLRFDLKANRRDKESPDKLVFAEEEYFDFFNSPTSLFNYTFLYLLREFTVVFIGLSMKDDNIRRLLHYSRKERLEAHKDEKKNKPLQYFESRACRHFVLLDKHEYSTTKGLVERGLYYLGAVPVWLDGYDEVPKLLESVYSANGGNWASVYCE